MSHIEHALKMQSVQVRCGGGGGQRNSPWLQWHLRTGEQLVVPSPQSVLERMVNPEAVRPEGH